MNKGRQTRVLITSLLTLLFLILIVVSTLPESGDSSLSAPFSAVLRPVTKVVGGVGNYVSTYWRSIGKNRQLKAENDQLKQELAKSQIENKQHEAELQEYAQIKEALKLKDKFDYTQIEAVRVLTYPSSKSADLYKVDKGFSDGFKPSLVGKSYAVVDSRGNLFGRVYRTDKYTSQLIGIEHEGFAANCFSDGDPSATFRLRGDITYKADKLCIIDQIPSTVQLKTGDKIFTSGEGGIFPQGILAGVVSELLPDDRNGQHRAIVKPARNSNADDILFVLTGAQADEQQ